MKKRSEKYIFIICIFVIFLNVVWIFNLIFLNNNSLTGFVSFGELFFGPIVKLINVGQIFINIIFQINVDSPQNITYNFSVGENYTISLNVSSLRNITSWTYSHYDLEHGSTINESVSFTPNSTINAVRWSNKIIVFGNDSINVFNKTVVFFVNVPNSAPIIELIDSEIFVCENSYLSYLFNVTDTDEDSPVASISPAYSSTQPFLVTANPQTNINLTVNRYELYSGTLTKINAGGANGRFRVYQENISVSDGEYSDLRQTNLTVIEINNAPSITNIGVQTIWARGQNTSFYKQALVTDIEDGNQNSGNLSFDITITNSSGSIIGLFNISSSGIMNFTANLSYLGIYTVNVSVTDTGLINPHQNISDVCGQDGGNKTSNNVFSLTVTDENRPPQIDSYYPLELNLSVNEGEEIYFNVSMSDPDETPLDTYWYIDEIFEEYDSGVEQGGSFAEFRHTFNYTASGNHNIIVKVTDGILNSSYDYVNWSIIVNDTTPPPTPPPSGGGGGGGGGISKKCGEKWGCEVWGNCKNLKESYYLKHEINSKEFASIKGNCSLFNWSKGICGYQTRNCSDLNKCNTGLQIPQIMRECYYTEFPDCNDSIQNCHDGDCEVLADCGGPCPACPTCSDGIQNQNEGGIDCGGPCTRCVIEEKPGIRTRKIFIYLFLIIFVIAMILVIKMLIKSYITEKSFKNEILSKYKFYTQK